MKYAEVVVDTPIHKRAAFHYSIPSHLAGSIAVGQLVKVPFGPRSLQGIVVGLGDTSPVAETRDIEEVLEPKPVLTSIQIELARWISSYYLAPLRDCLRLMLPPGLARRSELIIRLREGKALPDDLGEEEHAVVELLRCRGEMELKSLGRELGLPRVRSLVDGLERRRIVTKRWELSEPKVRPKRARFVRLIAEEDEVAREMPHLGYPSKQAKVLEALAASDPPLLTLSEVRARAGCSRTPIYALVRKGYVQRIAQGPTIVLRLPKDELRDKLIELRRLEYYISVLDFLRAKGGSASLSEVYAETGCYLYHLRRLAERNLVRIKEREVWRGPLAGREFVLASPPKLTPDQEAVWERIEKGIENRKAGVYLLHGVTGSGKTEIYLRAVQEVLAHGRQAIVMVPEISLTPQTIRRFAARFPARLAVLHSKLSPGERYDEWRRIRAGQADVVIGPRSAIFAPLPRLGL
ncbi:MAG: DEAD/DEAH box helicase family protein, partial [Chloroflexota bacterium]|nr:DEAD/DEAH box helicase family protein [Chloroflexota bacterium]